MDTRTIDKMRTKLARDTARRDMLQTALAEHMASLEKMTQRTEYLTKAREIIMLVGKLTQQQLEYQISNLVSLALATVFDDPYTFSVQFIERHNMVEADLLLQKGDDTYDPLESVGGGVVDVVSFALRITDWKLRGGRAFIAFDEQFRNVSRDRQPKVGLLLKRLSEELHIQIVLVSHQNEVNDMADKVFLVKHGEVIDS
jgi:DNA repair exonuclease SbcCD ATPase subunit